MKWTVHRARNYRSTVFSICHPMPDFVSNCDFTYYIWRRFYLTGQFKNSHLLTHRTQSFLSKWRFLKTKKRVSTRFRVCAYFGYPHLNRNLVFTLFSRLPYRVQLTECLWMAKKPKNKQQKLAKISCIEIGNIDFYFWVAFFFFKFQFINWSPSCSKWLKL